MVSTSMELNCLLKDKSVSAMKKIYSYNLPFFVVSESSVGKDQKIHAR